VKRLLLLGAGGTITDPSGAVVPDALAGMRFGVMP
jgi:hypothetical protein